MTNAKLWEYFWNKKIAHTHPLGKDFIWVSKEDFQTVEKYFTKEYNIFYPGISMRSRGYWKHVHAVEQDDCVFVHQDIGNFVRFPLLGIVHFFVDMMPYLIFVCIKRIPLHSLFVRPGKL